MLQHDLAPAGSVPHTRPKEPLKLEPGCRGSFKEPFRVVWGHIGAMLALLEHGCRMSHAGVPPFFVLGLEDGGRGAW